MSSGALSVALSSAGVGNFLKYLTSTLTSGFQGFAVPDLNIPAGVSIPSLGVTTDVDTVSVSQGTVNTVSGVTVASTTQSAGGNFTVVLTANTSVAYGRWEETGSITIVAGETVSTTSFDDTYNDFNFSINPLTVTLTLRVYLDSNTLKMEIVSKSSSTAGVNVHVPSNSALTSSIFPCINDKVKSKVADYLSSYDYATPIANALAPLFSTIPNSGNITNDIVFQFYGQEVQFPNDSGLQYRVDGKFKWKGTYFPGALPSVPLPAVPGSDHDASALVTPYELNGLGWSFFNAGSLVATYHKTDIPLPDALTTQYYATALPALAQMYPNKNMFVYMKANAAPTFAITKDSTSKNVVQVQHLWRLDVSIEGETANQPVLSFDINETNTLYNFVVATGTSNVQVLQFGFTDINSSASLVASTIPGLTPGDPGAQQLFAMVWQFCIRPVFANVISMIGKAGVALPSTLTNIFTNWAIEIQDTLLSVKFNFNLPGVSLKQLALKDHLAIPNFSAGNNWISVHSY